MKLVFLGPPGAGKGTQAKLLPEFFQISTGEVIRTAFKNNDPILSKYQTHIEKGGLLPDELIFNLIEQEIKKIPKKSEGYILDGAVRTLPQAEFVLRKGLGEIFINFYLSEDKAKKRIEKRRHIENRKEDSPDAMEKRFIDYKSENQQIVRYLCLNSSNYISIDASKSIKKIHKDLLEILKTI